ncbi:MAG TPA: hypothetical protein VIF62_14860 [Labilithrix sp.]
MWFRRIVVVAAPLAAACGLSVTGELVLDGADGGTPPGSSDDGGGAGDAAGPGDDAGVVVPEAGDPCAPCGFVTPPGFTLVGYGAPSIACPGDAGASDVVEGADASVACACAPASCTVLTKPGCLTGTIPTTYDTTSTATCGQTGGDLSANNGACVTSGGTFGQHTGIGAPAPVGTGTCTSMAVANKAAAVPSATRVCAGTTCEALCNEGLDAGLRACASADGDVPCPNGFSFRRVVGTDFDVACGNCAACSVTATACSGTTTFYTDNACNNGLKAFASGACLSAAGASFSSYKWSGSATGTACNPSGPPHGTVTLVGPRTICCK